VHNHYLPAFPTRRSSDLTILQSFIIYLPVRYRLVSLCMRNPEYTKKRILQRSAVLFNTRGYQATSVSDITDATGFTKGAIYRHFKNKEELVRQSLATMAEAMYEKMRAVVK